MLGIPSLLQCLLGGMDEKCPSSDVSSVNHAGGLSADLIKLPKADRFSQADF